MAKQAGEQVETKPLGEYVPPGGDTAGEGVQLFNESAPPEPDDLNSYRVALVSDPDAGLVMFDFSGLASVSPVKALCIVVRCLERVLPLVPVDSEFGPLARKALEVGVRCCRGEKLEPPSAARHIWNRLATLLRDSLNADAVDPAIRAGTGQAVLVALAVLDAVDSLAEQRPWAGYRVAAKDASAAIGAGSPFVVHVRDQKRLTAAVVRDVQSLTAPSESGETAPAAAGVLAAFGPLWVDEPPHVFRIAQGSPRPVAAELTLLSESPKLGPVPTAEPVKKADEHPATDPLAGLSVPASPLSPQDALKELGMLIATVRSERSSDLIRFREVLKSLAGHTFATREAAMEAADRVQEARALLGVGFVMIDANAKKRDVRVSIFCEGNKRNPHGRFVATMSKAPQGEAYSGVAFPALDVIELGTVPPVTSDARS